jgi:predicted DCC family thiol-disulfide oxidoreductase YuxK
MKPILIYDGYCNLCINLIRTLEPQNRTSEGGFKMCFMPFQKADALIEQYGLKREELKSALHFISKKGEVFKAGEAVGKLSESFPMLKVGSGFFKTELGEKFYKLIAANRYGIFGCADECYISEFYQSEAGL